MTVKPAAILFINGGPLGQQLTGPAIRCLELARQVSTVAEVTIAARSPIVRSIPGVKFRAFETEAELLRLVNEHDAFVAQGAITLDFPQLLVTDRIKVFDLYDPLNLEILEHLRNAPAENQTQDFAHVHTALHGQLATGDFFLCANKRQRDYWLGMLAGTGRLNPVTYESGWRDLSNLLAIVPMGIQAVEPIHTRQVLRGVHPSIQATDIILIWAGSLLDWFDPLTLIRAMASVTRQRSDVKLFFMASRHPQLKDRHSIAAKAIELSRELGLDERTVIFNDEWIPFDERSNYLLEADLGVTTHFDHLETYFSFRTRVLDYLWASLPIITSRGDMFSELVEQHQLGRTVPTGDVEALAQAILELAQDVAQRDNCREHVRQVAHDFRWEKVAQPLVEFCRKPHRAGDLAAGAVESVAHAAISLTTTRLTLINEQNLAEIRRARRASFAQLAALIKLSIKRLLKRRYTMLVFNRLVIAGEPLLPKRRVVQKFRAYAPNLNGLDVLIGTFGRVNTCEVILHLDDGITSSVNALALKDCEFYTFAFASVAASAGREFTFWIESPDAVSSDAVAIFYYAENGEIVFKQHYG